MLVSTLIVGILAVAVERAVEAEFGLPGIIGLMMLRTGIRKRNLTIACVGVTVLVMLVVSL